MGRFRTENSIFIAGKSMEIGRKEGENGRDEAGKTCSTY